MSEDQQSELRKLAAVEEALADIKYRLDHDCNCRHCVRSKAEYLSHHGDGCPTCGAWAVRTEPCARKLCRGFVDRNSLTGWLEYDQCKDQRCLHGYTGCPVCDDDFSADGWALVVEVVQALGWIDDAPEPTEHGPNTLD